MEQNRYLRYVIVTFRKFIVHNNLQEDFVTFKAF